MTVTSSTLVTIRCGLQVFQCLQISPHPPEEDCGSCVTQTQINERNSIIHIRFCHQGKWRNLQKLLLHSNACSMCLNNRTVTTSDRLQLSLRTAGSYSLCLASGAYRASRSSERQRCVKSGFLTALSTLQHTYALYRQTDSSRSLRRTSRMRICFIWKAKFSALSALHNVQ